MLMTWVHMQRYDDMLEASLLLMGIVLVLAVVLTGLVSMGMRAVVASSQNPVASIGRRSRRFFYWLLATGQRHPLIAGFVVRIGRLLISLQHAGRARRQGCPRRARRLRRP